MFFAPNPGILAAGVSTQKTYADFASWAATQGGALNPNSGLGSFRGLVRVSLGNSFSGNMYGSPWGSGSPVSTDSLSNRIALHSFLSRAAADANLGRIVLLNAVNFGSSTFTGLDRNSYLSLSYGTPEASFTVDRFDYFDDASGRIVRVNPRAQTFEMVDVP